MRTVNIGILAHVDAGKTSLTERLLHHAGVIDTVGRVDHGDTQTDALDQERRRGITIRSAVAGFTVGDVAVNLVDTPGHADFVAEVERALSVLDGVVLVVSAVEGVQAHTRLLMRVLTTMRLPVLVFVNKIDRVGARYRELLADIRSELTAAAPALQSVDRIGHRDATVRDRDPANPAVAADFAELLADHDDALTARYLGEGPPLRPEDYRAALERAATAGRVHPVLFGSAATGAGIADLAAAIPRMLPVGDEPDPALPLRATVFKVERGWGGGRVAYARLYSGTLTARDQVEFHRRDAAGTPVTGHGRVTGVAVVARGVTVVEGTARAGQIARLTGLKDLRIGDRLGVDTTPGLGPRFGPPRLETVVTPRHPRDRAALWRALTELAETDPFIDVRADADGAAAVSLYGRVQQEVLAAGLADDHGVPADFAPPSVIRVERPLGTGTAVESIGDHEPVYFWATVGLRVEAGAPDSGVGYRIAVERGSLPAAFHTAVERTVRDALRQGLHGWPVTDIVVTLTHSGYDSVLSTAADFRDLTPLVLAAALRRAGTAVLEPVDAIEIEAPADCVGTLLPGLIALGAAVTPPTVRDRRCLVTGTLPVRLLTALAEALPGLTRGEGVLTNRFHAVSAVPGEPPTRARTGPNPHDRDAYLLDVLKAR